MRSSKGGLGFRNEHIHPKAGNAYLVETSRLTQAEHAAEKL